MCWSDEGENDFKADFWKRTVFEPEIGEMILLARTLPCFLNGFEQMV